MIASLCDPRLPAILRSYELFGLVSLGFAIYYCYWFRPLGVIGYKLLLDLDETPVVSTILVIILLLMCVGVVQSRRPFVPSTLRQAKRAALATAIAVGLVVTAVFNSQCTVSDNVPLYFAGKEARGTITEFDWEPVETHDGRRREVVAYVTYKFITEGGQSIEGHDRISDYDPPSDGFAPIGEPIDVVYAVFNPNWNSIVSNGNRTLWGLLAGLAIVLGAGIFAIFETFKASLRRYTAQMELEPAETSGSKSLLRSRTRP